MRILLTAIVFLAWLVLGCAHDPKKCATHPCVGACCGCTWGCTACAPETKND